MIAWFIYLALSAAVIVIDRKHLQKRARAAGEEYVDFRLPTNYLALAVVSGPIPLIFYYRNTRRAELGWRSWLLGIGAAVGVYVATVLILIALALLVRTFAHAGEV